MRDISSTKSGTAKKPMAGFSRRQESPATHEGCGAKRAIEGLKKYTTLYGSPFNQQTIQYPIIINGDFRFSLMSLYEVSVQAALRQKMKRYRRDSPLPQRRDRSCRFRVRERKACAANRKAMRLRRLQQKPERPTHVHSSSGGMFAIQRPAMLPRRRLGRTRRYGRFFAPNAKYLRVPG